MSDNRIKVGAALEKAREKTGKSAGEVGREIGVTWWSYPVVVLTGILGGLLVGAGIAAWLAPAQVEAWGWRIPFIFGLLILPMVALYGRAPHIRAQV